MKTAIGYVRVSTDDQTISIDAQRSALEQWASSNGAELVSIHVDHGVSGATPIDKRPGMLSAVAELAAGSVLVVAKRDRVARDVMIAAMTERLVSKRGAELVSVDGVGNGDTPEAGLMRSMVACFAQYERALIAARTKTALATKRANGQKTGGAAPFGYRRIVDANGVARLELDDQEQRAVAIITDLRASGLSYSRIARELNARGQRTRHGKVFSHAHVSRAIKAAARYGAAA